MPIIVCAAFTCFKELLDRDLKLIIAKDTILDALMTTSPNLFIRRAHKEAVVEKGGYFVNNEDGRLPKETFELLLSGKAAIAGPNYFQLLGTGKLSLKSCLIYVIPFRPIIQISHCNRGKFGKLSHNNLPFLE